MANPTDDLEPDELPEGDPPEDDPEDDPEGDPPEEDPEADPEPEPEPEPEPQRQSRAAARIQRQQAENKRLRDEVAATQRQIADLQRNSNAAQQAANQQRQAEQLAAMDPDQRAQFLQDQRFQGLQREIQQSRWELQEATDKNAWQSRATTDAVAKKYAQRVEAKLLEMRQNGQTAPRETVYHLLLGQDMATKGPKAVAGARAAAKGRVASASGSAANARGNVARNGRADPDSIEALEERLGKAIF